MRWQGGTVLSEVLVISSALYGQRWVGLSQILGSVHIGGVAPGAAVDGEVGGLVDERSSLRVATGGWEVPEGTAEVDLAELVWI